MFGKLHSSEKWARAKLSLWWQLAVVTTDAVVVDANANEFLK